MARLFKTILLTASLFTVLACSGQAPANDWSQKSQEILGSETATILMRSLGGNGSNAETLSGLSLADMDAGLREALRIGTQSVVGQLGQTNGFNLDTQIRIPLPQTLQRVDQALSAVGMNGLTSDLELRLNRAAELATPKAKALFISAIQQMTIADAKNILTGPNDAATQYLRRAMGPQLQDSMQPLITQSLASAGAVQAYDRVMGQYGQLPFMPDVKANLNSYVSEKAMDGIFHYVAQEEAAIRTNPAARTTDLLKKVFSATR